MISSILFYSFLFQSTPSARRATHEAAQAAAETMISIHALREEGDADKVAHVSKTHGISIHALREEGDLVTISDCQHR